MATNKQIIEFQGKGIAKLKSQYKELERRTKGLEGATKRSSKGLVGMAAALGLTTVALYAAQKAISGVVRVGAQFEKNMSNVAAISGAAGDQLAGLEKNARSLGATTVFTASQVAGLQVEFAKLGFTSKEIRGVTKDTLALASATGSDLSTSAAVAGGTLRAFGLDVSETSRITDTMALSFSSSALDMDKFTNSMTYVGPIAKAAGIDVEGATAMLGTLSNSMISGSMAGTSLRKILLEAGKEGSKLAKRFGGPIRSMDDFQKGLLKLREEGFDVMAEGADLVGAKAVTAFGVLLDGVEKTDVLAESLSHAGGAAQRMADIQLDNLAGRTTLLNSAMEGLGISLFDHVSPSLNSAVIGMTDFINSMNSFMAIPTSEKMRDEADRVNTLSRAIEISKVGSITRNKLVKELNGLYPDLLKGLSDEEIAQGKLTDRLKTYNTQQALKIALAKADEKTLKLAEDKAVIDIKVADSTIAVADAMEKMSKETGMAIDPQLSLAENYENLLSHSDDWMKQMHKESKDLWAWNSRSVEIEESTNRLAHARMDLIIGYKTGSPAIKSYIELLSEQEKLAVKLSTAEEIQVRKKEIIIKMYSQESEAVKEAVDIMFNYANQLRKTIEVMEKVGGESIITSNLIFQAQRQQVEDTLVNYQQVTDGIMNVSNKFTEMEMQNIDNRRQKEIDAAMASGLNEEAKQAKIQNIKEKYAKQERDLRKKQKAPMIAQAIANTAVGVTQALKQSGPVGIALGVLVAAAGALEVATISAQEFATGGDFVTSGPQMIKVGDNPGGAERVQVTPLSSPNINGPQGGGGITLNISAPLVDETILDVILPAIEKAGRMNLA